VNITGCACSLLQSLQPYRAYTARINTFCRQVCFRVKMWQIYFVNVEKLLQIYSCDTTLQSFLHLHKVLFNFRGTCPRCCNGLVNLSQYSSARYGTALTDVATQAVADDSTGTTSVASQSSCDQPSTTFSRAADIANWPRVSNWLRRLGLKCPFVLLIAITGTYWHFVHVGVK